MRRIATLAAGIALMAPGTALAQESSECQAYNSQVSCTTATTQPGALPFTGIDVAALLAGGGVLIGGGLVMRRAAHQRNN